MKSPWSALSAWRLVDRSGCEVKSKSWLLGIGY